MALKELSFGTGSKFDVKNRILESCSSSLKRDLRSSFPLKSSFSGTCNLETSERISNVILQSSKISLENKIITSSNLKRKYNSEDGLCSKRTVFSQVHSSLDQGDDLLPSATYFHQTEYINPLRSLSNEADLEVESLSAKGNNSSEPLPSAHQMPHYEFSPLKFDDIQDELCTAKDKLVDYMSEKRKEEQLLKDQFLTLVSTSLMHSPNFRDLSNEFCQLLLSKAEEVASHYPEFILKVALYTRQELNIRTTANFLLAYAAHNVNSRYYLKRYFSTSICLPSDWIEVAEICKKLSEQNGTSFPSALRKAMVEAFLKFDNYQLAKYNRDPIKQMKKKQRKHLKQKKKENVVQSEDATDDQENIVTTRQIYTLKRLIQVLHITEPVEHVMCIIGKKYPIDFESFQKSKLPGSWDEEKAGKRMKLPVPVTWETEVSSLGNKAAVWEKLIDKKKLPYMAMLRNIRNLVITGISRKHHDQVLKKLCDEKTVMKSKQFPFRFFAAYEAIHQLEMICSKNECSAGHATYVIPKKDILPTWKKKLQQRLKNRASNVKAALLKEYRLAIDKAVEVSCRNNVAPIQGKTLVICDVLSCCNSDCRTLKGSLVSKMHQACILLGMMISCVAEECELKLVKCPNSWETLDMEDGFILNNVHKASSNIEVNTSEEEIQTNVEEFYNEALPGLLNHYLCAAVDHVQLDQIVLLTSGKYFYNTNGNSIMEDFAKKIQDAIK